MPVSPIGAFPDSYETASRSTLPDPLLWDLWAVALSHENVESWVPNYRDLGRADLTARELRKRHTGWTSYPTAAPQSPPPNPAAGLSWRAAQPGADEAPAPVTARFPRTRDARISGFPCSSPAGERSVSGPAYVCTSPRLPGASMYRRS